MNVFSINIEFERSEITEKIESSISINVSRYVCVVDANVLAMSSKNESYRNVINSAFFNLCDGSSISTMVNIIHGTKFIPYNGPDIFNDYIKKPYKQLLLGCNSQLYDEIKVKLDELNIVETYLFHLPLPFKNVDEFDYKNIAEVINSISPDIIWVTLGAPKQEIFMSNILPLLKRGLLFGIGAAPKFFIGDIGYPKVSMGGLRFIWFERILREPKKQLSRILKIILKLPFLFFTEFYIHRISNKRK